jgi:hypothetical protein
MDNDKISKISNIMGIICSLVFVIFTVTHEATPDGSIGIMISAKNVFIAGAGGYMIGLVLTRLVLIVVSSVFRRTKNKE